MDTGSQSHKLTQYPFDTVNDDNTDRTFVAVRKDLVELVDLAGFGEANH